MKSREQFEKYAADRLGIPVGMIFDARNGGRYLHAFDSMNVMQPLNGWWGIWQASREAIGFDIEHPVCWRTYYPDTEDEIFREHSQSNESCAKRIASEIGGYVIPVYHGKPVHVEVKK